MGSVGDLSDFPKYPLDGAIATFLEHEHGNAEAAKVGGGLDQSIAGFLAGVAHEDQSVDFRTHGLLASVCQHAGDLGIAGATDDRRHGFGQMNWAVVPTGGSALAFWMAFGTAVVDELHVERADAGDFAEHFGLQLASGVPGLLPACSGVQRKDQTPVAGSFLCFLSKKAVNF